jgi:hypothetical protein
LNISAWISGPGLPANAPRPRSEAFARVEAQAAAFASGGSAASLNTANWSSLEWLHFIHSLPQDISVDRLRELDARFKFRDSGNSEILFAWLDLGITRGYTDVYPAVERFLTSQGRRKFLRPLYTKLVATPAGRQVAERIYERARPTYHPVSQESIDQILRGTE